MKRPQDHRRHSANVSMRESILLRMTMFALAALSAAAVIHTDRHACASADPTPVPVEGVAVASPDPAPQVLQVGNYSFAYPPAKPLENSMKASQGMRSFGFCSSVGGIAFGAIATASDDSRITGLRYDADRPDGGRLVITARNEEGPTEIVLPLHDWIALPVARFADGDQDALFTLYGELLDEEDEEWRKQGGQRIMNYHPAIQDTFLGLRLMQADLLAFHPIGSENLTMDDKVFQAPGETPRDVTRNRQDQEVINTLYQSGDAQSYVITDVEPQGGVRYHLAAADGAMTLQFAGRPYWACWRLTKDANQILQEIMEQQSETDENIQQARSRVETYIDANYFEELPELSQRLSDKMAELEGGNPPVYHALSQTMRYAAFFRHVKETESDVYAAFMRQIDGVTPQPTAQTPTALLERLDPSMTPQFGEVQLSSGFSPDPHTVEVICGGSINVDLLELGSNCEGYAAQRPDVTLQWTGSTDNLRVFFEATNSEDDATLIIHTPDGRWIGNDDAFDETYNPMLTLGGHGAGRYAIWVGSYWPEENFTGRLTITEEDRRPESSDIDWDNWGQEGDDGDELETLLNTASMIGESIQEETITTTHDGAYTHTFTLPVQAGVNYMAIAVSKAEKDIDMMALQNETTLDSDEAVDHYPMVSFTAASDDDVQLQVIIPRSSLSGEEIQLYVWKLNR